ncbi:MAG: methyl-accepting chemotaxis protein [Myxococcaceae bacterium]
MTQNEKKRRGVGLAPKLMVVVVGMAVTVALVLGALATSRLGSSMEGAFASKGEAIALSLAAAAERGAEGDVATTQGAVDSNKVIQGVAYIYIEDLDGSLLVHTFSPSFPERLKGLNKVGLGELSSDRRVKSAKVGFPAPGADGVTRAVRAIDIAAPVSGGALGVVHVGMDVSLIEQEVSGLRWSMFFSGGLVAALGAALAFVLISLMVVRPIRELTRVTGEIVEKGDLTQAIRIRGNDEIGQLAQTFTQMVGKLRQIPVSLLESSQLLTAAVLDLNKSTAEQGQTLTRQAAALQETQVTAQEIKQTSLLAAQKAEAVLQVAERADEIGRSGEAAIEQSLGGLGDIRSRVEEIALKIGQLSERTLQIGGITQTVKDLADQSNMLALNAAIEAVRSGEHGKGFAVVAREIRSLADQSIKATERVREILEDISQAIRSAVSITEKGSQRMESGLVQMKASGENLRELSKIVKDNSAAVRQIAAAVSQQNAGITQIFTAVTDQTKMMDDTMKRLSSTGVAAETIRDVSERVSAVVNSYRV